MFLWSGTSSNYRKAPIAWDIVCNPKSVGGLNIILLAEWNQATMLKLLWNIQGNKDKLWIKWLEAYYVKGGNIQEWNPSQDCSWILKRIMKSIELCGLLPDWNATLHEDKFATTKQYHRLRGEKHKVDWNMVLFNNVARPRAKF